METTIRAVYKDGSFQLPHQLELPDGQLVELIVKVPDEVEDDPAFDLAALAVETGIPDLAVEHDHYLYGTPKRGE